MGDTSDSLPSDDSGVPDTSADVSQTPDEKLVHVEELADTLQFSSSHRSWQEDIRFAVERAANIDQEAIEWVLANVFKWESLDQLGNCEDLSPKNVKALKSALASIFADLYEKRELFLSKLASTFIAREKLLTSPLVQFFDRSQEELLEICDSEDIKACFSSAEIDSIKIVLHKVEFSAENSELTNLLHEIELILNDCSLRNDAVQEVKGKILNFESLESGLQSCEELTAKQVKTLFEKLSAHFDRLKKMKQSNVIEIVLPDFSSLSLPHDGIAWLENWLTNKSTAAINLNEIDLCEDLTKKQVALVKNFVRDFYKFDENANQVTVAVDSREKFLSEVEFVIARKDGSFEPDAKKWIMENIAEMVTLEDLHLCEDLTKKQISALKLELEFLFDNYRSTNPEIRTSGDEIFKQIDNVQPKNSEWSPNLSDLEVASVDFTKAEDASQFVLTKLITFSTEIQEGFAVDKFALSEDGMKYLCDLVPKHLIGDLPVFYNSSSNGTVIDFETLNHVTVECVGLFGPLAGVIDCLKRCMSSSNLVEFECALKSEKCGLYLLSFKAEKKKFIVFNSENDADFKTVKKDSRAVHFLRYMSQLCNNVVMCLDGNYEDRLAADEDRTVVKTDRRSRYNLTKHETQQESIKFTRLGLLQNIVEEANLFSSQNGLFALTYQQTKEEFNRKKEWKTGTVLEFKTFIESMNIRNMDGIGKNFKREYLKICAPEEFQRIEERVLTEIEALDAASEERMHATVVMSVALYFIETEMFHFYNVLKVYFMNNPEDTNDLWSRRIIFDCTSIGKVLTKENFCAIRSAILVQTERRQAIDKYLLWLALKRSDKLPAHVEEPGFNETTWLDLAALAEKSFNNWLAVVVGMASSNVSREKSRAAETIDYKNVEPELKFSIDTFLKFVCEIIEPFSKMPLFTGFCQSTRLDDSLKVKEEMLDREMDITFRTIMADRSAAGQGENPEKHNMSDSILLIRKHTRSAGDEPQFTCHYEKVTKEPAKTCVKLFQLSVRKEEHQRMSCGGNVLNVGEMEFLPVGELNASTMQSIHAAYLVSGSKLLILFNEQTRARCQLYNLPSMTNPTNMPFGKQISASSYDSKSRVLALRMQDDMSPWTIQLIKFDEEFKSRSNLKAVDLNKMFGVEKDFLFCLQPNSKYLWFYYDGRLRKVDYKTRAMVKSVKDVKGIVKLLCTPDGSCVLAYTDEESAFPVMTETGNVLPKISTTGLETNLFFMCNQMLCVKMNGKALSVDQITITGSEHETKLSKTTGWQKSNDKNAVQAKQEMHWINYLYWMYTKFPCNDILSESQTKSHFWFSSVIDSSNLCQQLQAEVESMHIKLQFTRKPLDYMQIHAQLISNSDLAGTFKIEQLRLGVVVKKLITFIPIQIARCQSNAFHILDQGQPISLEAVNVAFDLTEKIDLGFYESIFNSWQGDIKVISSMGKQSTGKSYTLNHLTGSSFNIAATRCTDGCWMTVKEQDDCLYVILDFEGLGSIERTEQDDMLLSLFNSSISTITIFKTEKRIDREIDRMFSKINMGSDQLKGTEKVFKGKFTIVINDVAEQDVEDTPKEFEEKISNIVCKTESNFIKKLYNNDFEIIAFPSLESTDYYENMHNLLAIVKHEIKPLFKGIEFVRTLKLLMAKLAINDFSPLDRQQIDERIRILRSYLKNAIHFGQTSDDDAKHKEYELKGLDNPSFKLFTEKEIDLGATGVVKINDLDTVFKEEQLGGLLMRFLTITAPTPNNFVTWRDGLERFVHECINLRFERVQAWLEENLRKWKASENTECDDIISGVLENLENWKLNFVQTYKFCEEKCAKCFLKCTQIVNHRNAHQCSTSHYCTAGCAYCDLDEAKQCKMAFGHDGKHVCGEVNHVCGAPCRFISLNGCVGECHKMTRHECEHECSERRHPCADVCSLGGCEGRCVIDCEMDHSVHKCIKEQCIMQCSVATCTNKCAALDHFHGTVLSAVFKDENGVSYEPPFLLDNGSRVDCEDHFCGKEHQCDYDCKHEGFCRVWTEKQLKEETFDGQRDTFTYSLAFAEKGEKLKCRRKLEAFMRTHDGEHSCSTEVHICTAKCPTCENICDKPINHENDDDILHHARHGNMRKCFFIANEDDIQVGSHKYKVGEPAVAEMCHIFCNSLGRGHVHIIECDNLNPGQCTYSAKEDGRRHETTKYHPNPDIPKDEVTHEAYWTWTGFQDPCQEVDIEEFLKCPAFCSAEDHEKDDETMHCEMPLWHEPVKSLTETNLADGFLTKDGHAFPCNHPIGIYHFVLCLDDSGSMGGQPWIDLVNAVRTFVTQRSHESSSDMLSIEVYNNTARVVAEYVPMTSYQESWLRYNCGGTDFSVALRLADDIIGRHINKNVIPVLIFMSDGGSYNGEIEMEIIAKKYRVAHGLEVYTLGFGNIYFDKLRELARLGHGEHIDAVNGVDLKTAFVDISAKHPPTIGVAF